MTIERIGAGAVNSRVVRYNGIVYLSGLVADDTSKDLSYQAREILQKVDILLSEAGTTKKKLISSTVYMSSIEEKDLFNAVWSAWIDKDNPPARACIGASLPPGVLVEIMVTAVADQVP